MRFYRFSGGIRFSLCKRSFLYRSQNGEMTVRYEFGYNVPDGCSGLPQPTVPSRPARESRHSKKTHEGEPFMIEPMGDSSMTTPPALHIRFAKEDEVPTILSFIRALAEYEHLSEEVIATPDALREQLFGPTRRAEVLFSCEDGVPVGIALFFHNFSTFLAKPGLYVEDIFVLPEHRGKGHGRALMISLANLAVERGCGRFEWTVLDWNKPAIDFYRSLGAESKSEWVIQRVSGAALTELADRQLFNRGGPETQRTSS
jgi:GNAT superfamily N-acetyltransferase